MSILDQTAAHRQIRVLVADDDPVLRSLIVANLGRRVDRITEAADGRKAWNLLLDNTFELAFIDLSMPDIDGYTLIECMRSHPRTRHMPIIVITSSSDHASVARAFTAGATSFLTKPVNWNLLGHHVDYLIRLSEGGDIARATKRRAEAASRAKDAVIATLAVRIREHMTTLIQCAQDELRPGLQRDASEPSVAFARTILAEALAVNDMCEATLPHLRTVAEQIVVDDRRLAVASLIEEGVRSVARLARHNRIAIKVSGTGKRFMVRCEGTAISRALSNLLRNAIQHSRDGGTVEVRVDHRQDNVLAIAVADDGRGADPTHIATCLRPLDARIGAAERAGYSVGLGLPIASAIAQAHGGCIEVATAPGHGTTAILILPADIVEVEHEDAA